ncbi:MAG: hypothetical protein ACE5IR_28110 [bacterium]
MTQTKKKEIFLAVSVLALIVLIGFQFLNSSERNAEDVTASDENESREAAEYVGFLDEYLHTRNIVIFDYEKEPKLSGQIKDPFQKPSIRTVRTVSPKPRKTRRSRSFKLNGILWHKRSPSAIINNKIVYVGSRIGKFRVRNIFQNKVILTSQKETHILKLK